MPLTTDQTRAFYKEVLESGHAQDELAQLPITSKGGGTSTAPLIKQIVVSRLAHSPQCSDFAQLHGDVYSCQTPNGAAVFTFRITASLEGSAWTNTTRSEAERLADLGGIYLIVWNPGVQRDRQFRVFLLPADDPTLRLGLNQFPPSQRVMVRVWPVQMSRFELRVRGAAPELLKENMVLELSLGDFEQRILGTGHPSPTRVIRELQGQGFEKIPAVRRAIELHAMNAATQYLENEGFEVTDVHLRKPYDLVAHRGSEQLYVEVKGTRGLGESIILTVGEVNAAKRHHPQTSLFVLHSISIQLDGSGWRAVAGIRQYIHPWLPKKARLKPLLFRYDRE